IPLIKNKAIQYSIAIVVVIFWIGVLSCRLYFHAHYLTDVIGGFSLGMIWVALFSMTLPLFNIKLRKK
ncbi:MAG: phosphatase PAP2 family protein, partial [Staphylococcus sp.]|nr:phosphatase PAP2 family protein [Staphylococcus sp.]